MSKLKEIIKDTKGMVIDGIAASEHVDSSGEILDVKGCDISDIEDGVAVLNFEHKDNTPTDIVGRIVYGKKIFSEEDCEDERQLSYWKKSGVPLIYIVGELLDADGHQGAKDLAAIFRHYSSRKLPVLTRFSIEGSTLDKKGNHLKESIFKRCAITVKPCNKDATSGVVHDPGLPPGAQKKIDEMASIIGQIDKKELPLGFQRLGGSIEIECDPILKAEPEPDLTEKVKSLLKRWSGEGSLKAFIKSNLPEVSDEFIDRFESLVGDFKIKTKIKKFEQVQELMSDLIKTVQPKATEPEHIEFGGQRVIPGAGRLFDPGTKNGAEFKLLGVDNDGFQAVPADKFPNWTHADLFKIPHTAHKQFRITKYPQTIGAKTVVSAAEHGIDLTPEAAQIVDGVDLDRSKASKFKGPQRGGEPVYNQDAFWAKNSQNKLVYVKPDQLETGTFGEAAREDAYHKLARDFLGLGAYVPTVGRVRSPQTGQVHAIVGGVRGEHGFLRPNQNGFVDQAHIDTQNQMLQSGELDKIGLMDTFLHNNDRHQENFLFTPDNKLKLLDHGFAFDEEPPMSIAWLGYFKGLHHEVKNPLHPEAVKWLLSMPSDALSKTLTQYGAPPEVASNTSASLSVMQNLLRENPLTPRDKVFGAPHNFHRYTKHGKIANE